METLQTVNEIIVDLYPYKFSVSETRDTRIIVAIRKLSDGDFDPNDSELIISLFNDIGKWESFAQNTSNVLRELGLSESEGSYQNFHYSPNKYVFEEATTGDETLRRFFVYMNPDERHRREALEIPRPTSAEIAGGIKNVGKWRSLVDSARLLRSLTA